MEQFDHCIFYGYKVVKQRRGFWLLLGSFLVIIIIDISGEYMV